MEVRHFKIPGAVALKKYLVFISGVRDELKAERLEAGKIIAELGAVPISMDGFDIAKDDDRRIIRKAIEDSDYFLNLTAHRGGEEVDSSFALELEYAWARKMRIPVLALIIGEKARRKVPSKNVHAKALEEFKKKLKAHPFDTWTNLGDFRQKALSLLSREMNLTPRRGWVPSNEAVVPSVANELSRLIRENESLRSQIRIEGTDIVKKVKSQMRQALKILAVNRISLNFFYVNSDKWENTRSFRYIKLFRLLAPELSSPKTAGDISRFFGNILNPDLGKTVRKDFPTPSNTIKKFITDLGLLKLVRCSGYGDNEVWEMTEYGKEAFAVYRLRQMNRNLAKKKASHSVA